MGIVSRSPRTADEEYTLNPKVTLPRTFGRGSPVLDYWLGHSEGFELTSSGGGHLGVVKEVVTDVLGYPRALIVRSGVLQRARVMNVDAVQAVVPAEGTITVRTNRRTRIALLRHDPRRGPTAVVARTAVSAARIMWMTSVLALTSLASAVGWTARGLRTNVPVLAALAGRTSASAATWARPHGRTLARLTGAAVITVALFVLALAHALAAAIAAYARFVAHEWARRRSGRMTPFS